MAPKFRISHDRNETPFEESSGYFCHIELFRLVRDGFSKINPKKKTKTGSALVGFVVTGVSAPRRPSEKITRNPL